MALAIDDLSIGIDDRAIESINRVIDMPSAVASPTMIDQFMAWKIENSLVAHFIGGVRFRHTCQASAPI